MARYWANIAVLIEAESVDHAYRKCNDLMDAWNNDSDETLAIIGNDRGDGWIEEYGYEGWDEDYPPTAEASDSTASSSNASETCE